MSYGGYGLKLPNVGQAPTFFSDVRIAYRTEQFLVQKHSYIHKCVFVFFLVFLNFFIVFFVGSITKSIINTSYCSKSYHSTVHLSVSHAVC